MWELIRQNRRKSFVLFILMGAVLLLLGYFIGAYYQPEGGGYVGLAAAAAVWMILSLISYFSGDSILLSTSGAQQVSPDIHPQLFNVVEEMKIAAGLPKTPKVYIIDDPSPNAFATGRSPETSSIAVTAGLLSRMNRDELQGVIAHETSHILNRDILFMTFAGVMLGSITIISQIFLRGMFYTGGSRRSRSRSSSGGGGGAAIIAIVALIFAILAPIMAQLLYFAISRKREYLADASGVRLTRYPEGLASALEKIGASGEPMTRANKITAPLYIVNPLAASGASAASLTSTHPPIKERVKILRAMSRGAAFANYQEAYDKIFGKKERVIPDSGLKDSSEVPIRAASAGKEDASTKAQKRDMGDLLRAVNQYLFVTCACGLKFKIPPDINRKSFPCTRCGREIAVPVAEIAAASAVLQGVQKGNELGAQTAGAESQALAYRRTGVGWESFSCSCGNPIQLSPVFAAKNVTCRKCRRIIRIQ